MARKSNKISTRWIRETRNEFRAFLDDTNFPDPERLGERGPAFTYPEWLIMFIAILSVKLKIKTYVQIHKMAVTYWEVITEGLDLTPISERQLPPSDDSQFVCGKGAEKSKDGLKIIAQLDGCPVVKSDGAVCVFPVL